MKTQGRRQSTNTTENFSPTEGYKNSSMYRNHLSKRYDTDLKAIVPDSPVSKSIDGAALRDKLSARSRTSKLNSENESGRQLRNLRRGTKASPTGPRPGSGKG